MSVAIVFLRRDLDQRKRAEEALRRRETELRDAQRVANVGSWEWIVETGTFTWSEELYHIAGGNPEEAPPNYKELPEILTPQSWLRLRPAMDLALKTGAPYELDLEMVRPDGLIRWIAARGEAVRDSNNHITKIRGTIQDITDRKRADEEFRISTTTPPAAMTRLTSTVSSFESTKRSSPGSAIPTPNWSAK